jgi:hypothetical protein
VSSDDRTAAHPSPGEWRPGTGLDHDPPDIHRSTMSYSSDEVAALTARLRDVQPADR